MKAILTCFEAKSASKRGPHRALSQATHIDGRGVNTRYRDCRRRPDPQCPLRSQKCVEHRPDIALTSPRHVNSSPQHHTTPQNTTRTSSQHCRTSPAYARGAFMHQMTRRVHTRSSRAFEGIFDVLAMSKRSHAMLGRCHAMLGRCQIDVIRCIPAQSGSHGGNLDASSAQLTEPGRNCCTSLV